MFGCRALYQDGWKAVTYHPVQDTSVAFADDPWELYHVAVDPSECHDLAAAEPERLAAMVDRWWVEARTYGVLPLDNRPFSELVFGRPRPVAERASLRLLPGGGGRARDGGRQRPQPRPPHLATVEIPEPGPAAAVPKA